MPMVSAAGNAGGTVIVIKSSILNITSFKELEGEMNI